MERGIKLEALTLARSIIEILEEKKAEEIILLDLKQVVNFTDYFVIANGTSDRMLDALKNAILRGVKTKFQKTGLGEGLPRTGWVVIDYGDVVVHMFSPEQREFYQLDELWKDGKVLLHVQ